MPRIQRCGRPAGRQDVALQPCAKKNKREDCRRTAAGGRKKAGIVSKYMPSMTIAGKCVRPDENGGCRWRAEPDGGGGAHAAAASKGRVFCACGGLCVPPERGAGAYGCRTARSILAHDARRPRACLKRVAADRRLPVPPGRPHRRAGAPRPAPRAPRRPVGPRPCQGDFSGALGFALPAAALGHGPLGHRFLSLPAAAPALLSPCPTRHCGAVPASIEFRPASAHSP